MEDKQNTESDNEITENNEEVVGRSYKLNDLHKNLMSVLKYLSILTCVVLYLIITNDPLLDGAKGFKHKNEVREVKHFPLRGTRMNLDCSDLIPTEDNDSFISWYLNDTLLASQSSSNPTYLTDTGALLGDKVDLSRYGRLVVIAPNSNASGRYQCSVYERHGSHSKLRYHNVKIREISILRLSDITTDVMSNKKYALTFIAALLTYCCSMPLFGAGHSVFSMLGSAVSLRYEKTVGKSLIGKLVRLLLDVFVISKLMAACKHVRLFRRALAYYVRKLEAVVDRKLVAVFSRVQGIARRNLIEPFCRTNYFSFRRLVVD